MRNWHHKVIKINEARNLLNTANSLGSSDIYIGVIEEEIIEFEKLNNANYPLSLSNYKPAHSSFSDILGTKKVFFRGKVKVNSKFNHEITADLLKSMHKTCVSGIISGNTDSLNLIEGICPNIRIIDSSNFQDSLFLALINSYTNGNVKSPLAGIINAVDLLNNGAEENDYYSNKSASVISCSFDVKLDSLKIDFILKELFAYARDGRGTLVIVSSGNGDKSTGIGFEINNNVGSINYRATVYTKKALIVGASKVLLNQNQLNQNSGLTTIFEEKKADYSNFGKRIDLCAPSGPDAYPSRNDINIYAPTIINGGDIGTAEQVFNVIVNGNPGSDELILENIKGVFKGQSLELGFSNSYNHEIRFIKNVSLVPNTNNVKVTLDSALKFTDNVSATGNFNIVGTSSKLLILKKGASRYTDSNGVFFENRLKLDNLKGINPTLAKPQKVYIYHPSYNLLGIETEIVSILNLNTNSVEIKDSLSNLKSTLQSSLSANLFNSLSFNNLIVIPDQISFSAFYRNGYEVSDVKDIVGFFVGQQVLVKKNGSSEERVGTITGITYISVYMEHCPGNPGDSYTIKSLAYGNFTSKFSGTSAATPIVSGLAGLILSANNSLNAVEIKHILKVTTDQIGDVTYNDAPSSVTEYNYGYSIHKKFGTGRVNAEKAIKLALNWHKPDNQQSLPFPEIPVEKPILAIADKLSGGYSGNLVNVPSTEPVDSPDIWFNVLGTSPTLPSLTNPLNRIDTSKDQKLFIKVRNSGNRNTFQECDIRVYVAFTDEVNPAFPFPTMWYDQADVKLLSVVELPIINSNSEIVVPIEWKNIAAFWNTYNKQDSATGLRKRAYILVHVSPFDGIDSVVMTDNLRNNKQLTCKEIIVTHNGVSDRTACLPGNKLDITVGTELVSKSFDLAMENVLASELDTIKIKAIKKDRQTQVTDEIVFKKIGTVWAIESGSGDWIEFQTPTELATNYNGYKNIVFPHTINVNQEEQEVKLTIENA